MSQSNHIIGRHVFDIRFSRQQEAFALQNRFSALFYHEAQPIMETLFSRLAPGDMPLRAGQLAVDLGRIRYDRLEKDFGPRLREALEKELTQLLDQQAGMRAQGSHTSLIALLEHFLLTGSLPWWATGHSLNHPPAALDHLLQEHPEELALLLRRTGRHEEVQQRLAWQLPAGLIRAVVRLLEPEEAVFIIAYHADIVRINEAKPWAPRPVSDLEKTLWLVILAYLLADRGGHFNRKAFVKSTLEQMARHVNQAYAGLLGLLFRVLEDYQPVWLRTSALPGIIHALHEEELHALQPPPVPGEAAMLRRKMDLLRGFLLQEYIAGRPYPYDTAGLADIFMELIEKLPESTAALLHQVANRQDTWTSIAATFPETVLTALVRLKEPGEADFILHYSHKLEWLQREKQLVKTEGSGFHQSVWELILSFLWMERGNVFNTRAFLEFNIRRMARRYHLSYKHLLAFLVQGIAQDMRSERDSSLFHLLAVLFRESMELTESVESTEPTELTEPTESTESTGWSSAAESSETNAGHTVGAATPERLWAALFDTNPRYLVTLLQSAGTTPALRERIVYQLPVERLLPVFRLLPDGDNAVHLLQVMLQLAAGSLFGNLDRRTLQVTLLSLAWEVYEAGGYRYFDQQRFTSQVWQRLAAGASSKELETATTTREKEEGHTVISRWLAGFQPENRWQPLLDMLFVYLHEGRWPAAWPLAVTAQPRALLLQVVYWLLSSKPHALIERLERQTDEATAKKLRQVLRIVFRSTTVARQLWGRHDGEALLTRITTFMHSTEEATGDAGVGALRLLAGLPAVMTGSDEMAAGTETAAIEEELRRKNVRGEAREKEALQKERTGRPQQEGDPIYIGNAGLVLLHPLLPHFFAQLGLTEKGRFSSKETRFRAVLLLQCLVTGKEEHPEQELVLNKILCNLDPVAPAPSIIVCTEAETRLMDQLWEVLRQRWEKMKNTSADGIRVSFLQRSGALGQTPEGWTLRVEQRGIDVLLQFLPWGWNLIKLPWMDKTLFVEWT